MFSLRTLFFVIAVAALGAGALFANTFWLISTFVVLTFGILSWACLQWHEALWRGLFVFGIVYLLLAPTAFFEILPSTGIHAVLVPRDPGTFYESLSFQSVFRDYSELRTAKLLALHCMASLLFGAVGGLLFQWSTKRNQGSV
jgi:hypothetical protein